MKRILDPAFCYRPSYDTDVRATFERARREQQEPPKEQAKDEQRESALRLVRAAPALRR